MKTYVYLIRHSEAFKVNNILNSDTLQLQNEKTILSVNGEKIAFQLAKNNELNNIDVVYSSNYTRAISTAKYIANQNNLILNIDERFNERKYGVNNYCELPFEFEKIQFNDENFKMLSGESRKEVNERMNEALTDILNNNLGKKIVIVSHSTAIAFLLTNWCKVNYDNCYTFNEKVFFDGKWNYCETFKLEFQENKLLNIENIKFFK